MLKRIALLFMFMYCTSTIATGRSSPATLPATAIITLEGLTKIRKSQDSEEVCVLNNGYKIQDKLASKNFSLNDDFIYTITNDDLAELNNLGSVIITTYTNTNPIVLVKAGDGSVFISKTYFLDRFVSEQLSTKVGEAIIEAGYPITKEEKNTSSKPYYYYYFKEPSGNTLMFKVDDIEARNYIIRREYPFKFIKSGKKARIVFSLNLDELKTVRKSEYSRAVYNLEEIDSRELGVLLQPDGNFKYKVFQYAEEYILSSNYQDKKKGDKDKRYYNFKITPQDLNTLQSYGYVIIKDYISFDEPPRKIKGESEQKYKKTVRPFSNSSSTNGITLVGDTDGSVFVSTEYFLKQFTEQNMMNEITTAITNSKAQRLGMTSSNRELVGTPIEPTPEKPYYEFGVLYQNINSKSPVVFKIDDATARRFLLQNEIILSSSGYNLKFIKQSSGPFAIEYFQYSKQP